MKSKARLLNMAMKFSIVTPSFNQGAFIGKCLASVAAQSSDVSLEHLIFDNRSTDETAAILHQCAQSDDAAHVQVAVEPDRGQTHAINKGFSAARGDVLAWLNTDEFYKPGALARVEAFFTAHPDVDVVFGDVEFVDAQQQVIRVRREPFYSESMLLYYGCFIPSCSTFVRRSAAQRAGELDESLKVVMDFEWYLRLARSGAKFAYLGEVLASFTWHDTNISSTFAGKRKSERLAIQSRYSRLPLPSWLRPSTFSLLRYHWIGVRVLRRCMTGAHAK